MNELQNPEDDDFGRLSEDPKRREMYRRNVHELAIELCGLTESQVRTLHQLVRTGVEIESDRRAA